MILNRLKLGIKVIIAPLIMAIMFSFVSYQTYTLLDEAQVKSSEITGNLKSTSKQATVLFHTITEKRMDIKSYITSFDDYYLLLYKVRDYEAAASIEVLNALEHDNYQLEILQDITHFNVALNEQWKRAIAHSVSSGENLLEDYQAVLALRTIGNNAEQAALHLQANIWQSMDLLGVAIEDKLSATTTVVLTVGLGAIITGLLIALFVAISITRPMKRMVRAMQNIAAGDGDLTRKLEVNGSDEMAQLAAGFNQFSDSIRIIIQEVLESTVQLSTAANDLKQHNSSAKNSINVQGRKTESVDSAVTNMNSTAHEIADNTVSATHAAKDAETAASESLSMMSDTVVSINKLAEAVEETSQSMSRLEEGSNSIGSVIDVIRGVAEQTNLLALNAAIEAARAGEHGRGFAVVADEVRTLASRTQESTEEIQAMIEALQVDASAASVLMQQGKELASESVEHVNQASKSLTSVSSSVDIMHGLNNQISTSAEQQSQVTTEVSSNIHSIKTMAVESATEMGQATDVSEQVNTLANELQHRMSRFKTA